MSLIRAMRRKISKNQKAQTYHSVNLDNISRNLSQLCDFSITDNYSGNHFADQFLILGFHQQTRKPILLFQFPSQRFNFSDESMNRFSKFAFPPPLQIIKATSNKILSQFVFSMNNSDNIIFCCCTHFCYNSEPFGLLTKEFLSFCMCTLTFIPQFNAHFDFHRHLIRLLLGSQNEFPVGSDSSIYTKESLQNEYDKSAKPNIPFPHLQRLANPLIISTKEMKLPKQFIDQLFIYLRIEVSSTKVHKIIGDGHAKMTIDLIQNSPNNIAEATFDILFNLLGVKDVVRYIRALLLEQRILVISRDPAKVTAVVLAAIPLMRPLHLRCSFIPLLPNSEEFLDFIDSPIPFVFGCLSTKLLAAKKFEDDMTIIDIDNGEFKYPEDIPHMPLADELRKSLRDFLKEVKKIPRPGTQEYEIYWEGITGQIETKKRMQLQYVLKRSESDSLCKIFSDFIKNLVNEDKLVGCRIRDMTQSDKPSYGFVRAAYFIDIKQEFVYFYEQLVDTQLFQTFFDQIAITQQNL